MAPLTSHTRPLTPVQTASLLPAATLLPVPVATHSFPACLPTTTACGSCLWQHWGDLNGGNTPWSVLVGVGENLLEVYNKMKLLDLYMLTKFDL